MLKMVAFRPDQPEAFPAVHATTGDSIRLTQATRGMASSGFDDLDADPRDLTVGYQTSDESAAVWRTNAYANAVGGMPDGGLITTATDLCTFIDAFRAGALVGAESRTKMLTSYARTDNDLDNHGYGMELWFDGHHQMAIFGHSGSDPGVSGMVSYFVDHETTIVVLCNHDRSSWAVSRHPGRSARHRRTAHLTDSTVSADAA